MSPRDEPGTSGTRGLGRSILRAGVAIVLYLLSTGPIVGWGWRLDPLVPVIEVLYLPLSWANERVGGQTWLDDYVKCWGYLGGDCGGTGGGG